MDHSEALRMHAAEKYVLGELPANVRDEYEDHFFDCQECAADVRTAVAFATTSRSAFSTLVVETDPSRESFFDAFARFFRPAWTAPALALLLIALSYQTFVAIPNLKQTSSSPAGSANLISLIGANSRAEAKSFTIVESKPLILDVDIPASAEFTEYETQLRDSAGRTLLDSTISAAEAKNTVHLLVSAGQVQPGYYTLSVVGRPTPPGTPSGEVLNIKFTLQVSP